MPRKPKRLRTDYIKRLDKQGGRCAICGRYPSKNRALAEDHDHEDGFIRGLLCLKCNVGLGYFGDDALRLRRAAEYLRKANEARGVHEW